MIFANMDAFKIAVEQAMDSSKELLRMGAILQERLNRQKQILGNLKI
jgi:hypothetical protein